MVVFERGGGIFLNELFFLGGGGFLPCTKSEAGKMLRHTKGTN